MSHTRTEPVSRIQPPAPARKAPGESLPDYRTEVPRPGLARSWADFWFAPADPVALHGLRVLGGLLFLSFLLPFAWQVEAFFGLEGWFDLQAYKEVARLPEPMPVPIGWSALYLAGTNSAALYALYGISVGVLVLFTLGIATRVTSVLTWVIVASFLANPAINYGADYLLLFLSFYLMIGYLLYGQWGRPLSLWGRLLGPTDAWVYDPWGKGSARAGSRAANLAVRLVQLHFALVVVVSGLHKLQFADWWAGVALWYPLHRPFETTLADVRRLAPEANSYLVLLSAVQYGMLAWQLGFPLFAWRTRWWWRAVLLGGALLGWAGLAFIYELPLFGPFLFVACLSYLTPAEWRTLLSLGRKKNY